MNPSPTSTTTAMMIMVVLDVTGVVERSFS